MAATLAEERIAWLGAERTLTADEIGRRVRAGRWAVLSLAEGDRPYAVPMAYGFDARRFYVVCLPGRKRRILDRSPLVSLTIVDEPEEEGPGSGYVLVLGRASPVTSPWSRLRAGMLILARFAGGLPSWPEVRLMARARIFRIEPHEVTGRILP